MRKRSVYGCKTEYFGRFENKTDLLQSIGDIPDEAFNIKIIYDDYFDNIEFSWERYETEEEEKIRLEKEAKDVIRKEQEELRLLAELKKKYNK